MDYQNMVNDLTGAMGPKQGAYPNYANAGNLDKNPFVDMSSHPLEYRSYVSHDGNVGYVPAYLFGRKSRASKRRSAKCRSAKRRSAKRKSRRSAKRRSAKRRSAKRRSAKRRSRKFGCQTCGGMSFGCGCGNDEDKDEVKPSMFGSANMCGALCG